MKKIILPKEPIVLDNKDFQTIQIKVMFPYSETTNDLAKVVLLPSMLMYMNNDYPNEADFLLEKKKNYILGMGCFQSTIGNTGCFSFSLNIPNSKLISEDYLEKQIKLFKSMIYNPKIVDNAFDEFELEREKKLLNMNIDNLSLNSMSGYHTYRIRNIIDDKDILSRNLVDNRNLIDEVNTKNLYEFYLDKVKNNNFVTFVMGDLDNNNIIELLNKHFYNNVEGETVFEVDYEHFLEPKNNEVEYIEEQKDFKDSALSFIYKIKDMSIDDYIYLDILKGLLSSLSSRLLSKKLRDEYDLIYSHNVRTYKQFGAVEITTFINKNNKDLVIEKIYEVMAELKNKDIIEPLFDNLKERRRLSLLRILDNKQSLFSDFIYSKLLIDDTLKESYDKLLKIKFDDLVDFFDRLELETIYFLKEGEHE